MEMGGNFCQILELGGGITIKGRRVNTVFSRIEAAASINIFSKSTASM